MKAKCCQALGTLGDPRVDTEKDKEKWEIHGLQFVPRTVPWTPCNRHQLLSRWHWGWSYSWTFSGFFSGLNNFCPVFPFHPSSGKSENEGTAGRAPAELALEAMLCLREQVLSAWSQCLLQIQPFHPNYFIQHSKIRNLSRETWWSQVIPF